MLGMAFQVAVFLRKAVVIALLSGCQQGLADQVEEQPVEWECCEVHAVM